jgi:dipeptidyl aminopeptidase/acylaminoacyl peptidase
MQLDRKCKWIILTLTLLILPAAGLISGNGDDKRPLSHDDYDSWIILSGSTLSADGLWSAYMEAPQKGDGFLVVRHLIKGTEYRHTIGFTGEKTDAEKAAKPRFSYDAGHIAFLVSPDKAAVDTLKESKNNNKKHPLKLTVMDLQDGQVVSADSVKSFKMPENAGGWLAYLKQKPKEDKKKDEEEKEKKEEKPEEKKKEEEGKEKDKKKDEGAPLILRNLKSGEETRLEHIADYRFTKNGRFLFYTVSSKNTPEEDGVYRITLEDGTVTPLLTGEGNYKKWALDREETRLAFVTDRDDYKADKPTFSLYGFGVEEDRARLWVSHNATRSFPEGLAVSDKSGLTFSDDGRMILFGIKEIPEPEKEEEKEEEKADFDLWHWNDPYPQPQQKKMADRVRDNTWESVYHIDKKRFVRLADETIPDVSLCRTGKIAFAQTEWPYSKRVSHFGSFYDVYVVDTRTGKKSLVIKELYGRARLSPYGKYVYWFKDNDWFIHDVKSGKTRNVTVSLGVPFQREDWDTPNPPYPYGVAGWTGEDDAVLIYDRFDIWKIDPSGKGAVRITEGYGRKNSLSFRYVRLDPEEITIDPDKTLLLRTMHEETMAAGFYQDRVNSEEPPVKLIMMDKMFSTPRKAKNAARLLFTRSDFAEYPDLWISDPAFSDPMKITNLGSQMTPFLWGREELRDFLSADGKPLKGILIKPENFDPSKKYPLMVYIYETLHSRLHSYRHPSPGTSINLSYYASNGYILWMPDIEYDTGYPGRDALKCVLPGIHMLIREGYVNPEAVGIQGHSWGGYQIAYMITQTHIFAAAEAGAPVSNMTSAYGGIRWGSGMVRQFQYEHTQSRLGSTLWDVPMRYIENSPVFWADKIETPVMFMHNDRDGAVPWYQGIEFIMALRRLGKEAYMFNYIGEEHGLRKRVNQEDWTRRMAEFFDHHLKEAPKAGWMKHGIKAWEKEKKE